MNRIQELESLIIKHKSLYYSGKPEISDADFDKLEDELRGLDSENAVLKIVGNTVLSKNKIKHDSKMLSLGKTYQVDELLKWKAGHDIVSTFKIDGVSCSLVYEAGHLSLGKTRGDGSFGEEITGKTLWVQEIPKTIQVKNKVEIRGELFCTEENFYHLSKEMVARGLEKPTSQRNIVAGLISRKDHSDLCQYIKFQAFEYIAAEDFKLEEDKFKNLKKLGFEIPEIKVHKSEKSLESVIDEARDFMSEGEYQIDGLVFTYNSIALHRELGYTAHHPRYKMAFKFAGESKQTIIKSIEWSVSRNGIMTPVAHVKPVELSGAMISRVTLHNYGVVEQHQLKAGDKIEIIRSGEVIPKFLNVIESSSETFEIPKKGCDFCVKDLEVEDIRLYCRNKICPGRDKEALLNFIQKIGIDDLSSKRLEELMRLGIVKEIPDLYKMKAEDLEKMDKVKEKLSQKIIENIEKSKEADITTLLSSLGITGGAYNKCEKVVLAGYNSFEKIHHLTLEQLMEIEGFAQKSAQDFLDSLQSKMTVIKELMDLGFKLEAAQIRETKVLGKKICITGALSEKRSVIEQSIRDLGGIVVSSVGKSTDFLVTNESEGSSSKYKKAQDLQIPIITEQALLQMMK